MPIISSGASMTTAITDLITGAMIIPIIISIRKKKCEDETLKKLWIMFFLFLSIGSILGFFTHFWMWSKKTYSLIWVFLYGVLYQILRSFLELSLYMCKGSKFHKSSEKLIFFIILITYIITAIMEATGHSPIRLFVISGICVGLPSLFLFYRCAVCKRNRCSKIILFAFIPQIFGVIYQLLRQGSFTFIWVFDYNSIYHLCLMVSTIIFYTCALQTMKKS